MESTFRRGAGDPDLKLIETLGWTGARFVRLELHLARLKASAARLGWTFDQGAVQAVLAQAVGASPARVRLTLDGRGAPELTIAPMPAAATLWQIGLAAQRLASADPWLTLKSTRRAVYDGARATLPSGLDEVIFQNERGEVCDGSITTLFFDAGHGLCTPPLSCGLLPGVLREDMLARGAAREAVLMARDLRQVLLWVGNSLRGLVPVRFG